MRPEKRRKSVTFDLPDYKSSDEEPLAKKASKLKKTTLKNDDSSSESDIENYLQPADKIDLDSLFFDVQKNKSFIEKSAAASDRNLNFNQVATSKQIIKFEKNESLDITTADSDSDGGEKTPSTSKLINKSFAGKVEGGVTDSDSDSSGIGFGHETPSTSRSNFQQLHDYSNYMKKMEETRRFVDEYKARKKSEAENQKNQKISNLLSVGEAKREEETEILEDLGLSLNSSDFDSYSSDSEQGNWEEVEENQKEKNIIPTEGLEITVEMPGHIKKKKKEDVFASIKRRINHIKKKNQILVHKVHLLSWIAHGNYISAAVNSKKILAAALSLVPSDFCQAEDRPGLEDLLGWFKDSVSSVKKEFSNQISLQNLLAVQISKEEAWNQKMLVYIFLAILRALGIQCRLVLSFRVEPIRPPNSELCSLKNNDKKPKNSHTEGTKVSIKTEKEIVDQKSSEVLNKNGTKKRKTSKKVVEEGNFKHQETENKKKLTINDNKTKSESPTEASGEKPNKFKRTYSLRNQTNIPQLDGVNDGTSSDDDVFVKATPKAKKIRTQPRFKIKLKNFSDSEDDFVPRSPFSSRNADSPIINVRNRSKQPPSNTTIKTNSKSSAKKSTKSVSELKTEEIPSNTTNGNTKRRTKSENKTKESSNTERPKRTYAKRSTKCESKTEDSSNTETKTEKSIRPATRNRQLIVGKQKTESPGTLKNKTDATIDETEKSSLNSKTKSSHRATKNDQKTTRQTKNKTESLRNPETNENIPRKAPSKTAKPRKTFAESQTENQTGSKTEETFPKVVLNRITDVQRATKEEAESDPKKKKQSNKQRKLQTRKKGSGDDSDYLPGTIKKSRTSEDDFQPPTATKRRFPKKKIVVEESPRKQKERVDVWVEVYLEKEGRWVSVDVTRGEVDCNSRLCARATQPVSYVIAWNNDGSLKDISSRYCRNFNTTTRWSRVDSKWWLATLKPFIGKKTDRDKLEDEELEKKQLDQPLPKTIKEYKNHPLYVLKRHLLKYEAIYPPEAPTLGFCRNEPVYSRQCVFILHPRYIWLKQAKVVKLGEKPYKIVKGRPRWDKLSRSIVTDPEEEVFGPWQVQDYEPPTAENGVVPRNAYGNVELFKPCMLPKKTVHLRLPGLTKIAKRMNIDCAPAFTGFNYSEGWIHPAYDGYVVCEEFEDILIAAWELEQDELEKKEQEKIDKRVYGNWKKLIKGLLIREKLKVKYDFGDVSTGTSKKRAKGLPKFSTKKKSK